MERTGIQVENEKSRPILTAKNICVLVYVLTPNNETGGSGEEPPVSSILESNSAKLRAKNSVLQSKMNNLCQISRQIFRRSFSRNSARYKTFMFLCQVPRLCQIDRLPCLGVPARAILIPEQPHSAQHRIRAGRQKPPQGGTRSRIERVERKDRRPTAVIRNFLKTLDIPSGKLQCPTGTRKRPGCSPGYARGRPQHEHRRHMASHINDYSILKIIRFGRWIDNFSLSIQSDLSVCI